MVSQSSNSTLFTFFKLYRSLPIEIGHSQIAHLLRIIVEAWEILLMKVELRHVG
jgi:hypothetical protein